MKLFYRVCLPKLEFSTGQPCLFLLHYSFNSAAIVLSFEISAILDPTLSKTQFFRISFYSQRLFFQNTACSTSDLSLPSNISKKHPNEALSHYVKLNLGGIQPRWICPTLAQTEIFNGCLFLKLTVYQWVEVEHLLQVKQNKIIILSEFSSSWTANSEFPRDSSSRWLNEWQNQHATYCYLNCWTQLKLRFWSFKPT